MEPHRQAEHKLHSNSFIDLSWIVWWIFFTTIWVNGRDFAESTSKTDSFYNILGSLDQAALPFTVLLQRTKIVQYTGIQTVFCEY